jgi:alpha-tubulin suppressor-like RCC1 family protein
LTLDHCLYCWGYVGAIDQVFTPSVVSLRGVTAVANGIQTCALLDTGAMECWGSNQYGQLGVGHFNSINSGPNPGVTTVLAGAEFWKR